METQRPTAQITRFSIGTILSLLLIVLIIGCKSAKIKDAELADKAGRYAVAADLYNRIYRQTNRKEPEKKGYVAFKAAENYAAMHNYGRALNLYNVSLTYKFPDSIVLLRIADCQRALNKKSEAKKYYQRYLAYNPNSEEALRGLSSIESGIDLERNSERFHIANEQKINSTRSDFGGCFTPDGSTFYFSSARSRHADDENPVTGENNNALYAIKKDANGKWSKVDSVQGGINDEGDVGTPALTPDGTAIYYSYAPKSDDRHTTVKIYKASKNGDGGWGKGQEIPLWKDSLRMAAHPTISANGKILYFVSEGGYGGKDIYSIAIANIGATQPLNLGPEINTSGDEVFPTAFGDSTLYFSSNGHKGLGGLDLYVARLDTTTFWRVTHLGAPINSYADEYGMAFTSTPKEGNTLEGYFSSTRKDARGIPHFFRFWQEAILTELDGFVYDRDETPIEGVIVRIVDEWNPEEEIRVTTRTDGYYSANLKGNTRYLLLATHPDYLNRNASFTTEPATENQLYSVDFHLAKRYKPEVFQNIYYDFDKAALRPESQKELDEMVSIMKENPDIRVEISSHADRMGSDAYNVTLSDKRAQSVVDYLVGKGIAFDRLEAKGYGKTKPRDVTESMKKKYPFLETAKVLDATLIESLDEEQKALCDQLNRRTEFSVIQTKQ